MVIVDFIFLMLINIEGIVMLIGEIVAVVSFISIPVNYLPADGRCLDFKAYSELSEILHDKDYWPWGKCENGFNLPDLRGNNKDSFYIIKVK